jgi:hypothetical protein
MPKELTRAEKIKKYKINTGTFEQREYLSFDRKTKVSDLKQGIDDYIEKYGDEDASIEVDFDSYDGSYCGLVIRGMRRFSDAEIDERIAHYEESDRRRKDQDKAMKIEREAMERKEYLRLHKKYGKQKG